MSTSFFASSGTLNAKQRKDITNLLTQVVNNDGNNAFVPARTNTTPNIPPTALELPNPTNGDTAIITLADNTEEFWAYQANVWELIRSKTPTSLVNETPTITSATQFDTTPPKIDLVYTSTFNGTMTNGQTIVLGNNYRWDGTAWIILNNKYQIVGAKTSIIKDDFLTNGTLTNGWIDQFGGIWSVVGEKLQGTTTDSTGFLNKFCLRPTSENQLNQEIIVDYPAGLNTKSHIGCVLRKQSNNANYFGTIDESGKGFIFAVVDSANIIDLTGVSGIPFAGYNNTKSYRVIFQATGSFPTNLRLQVIDLSTGTTVLNIARQDSTASLQVAGQAGFSIYAKGANTTINVEKTLINNFGNSSNLINTIFLGDSITFGAGVSIAQEAGQIGGLSYPGNVGNNLGFFMLGKNIGVSGKTATQMLTDTLNTNSVFSPDLNYKTGVKNNIVVIMAGTNDLFQASESYDVYTRIANISKEWRKKGFQVFVCTLLPGFGIGNENFNSNRNQVNQYLYSNWQNFADSLVDIASNQLVGIDGTEQNLTYFVDKIHPTDVGYKIIGQIVSRQIQTFLNQ